MDRLLI